MAVMAIDSAQIEQVLYCPSCKTTRRVMRRSDRHAAYCPACGTLLIDDATRLEYAGFWRRFIGWAIDFAIVVAVAAGVIAGLAQAGVDFGDPEVAFWTVVGAYQAISFTYYWPLVAIGGTPGKVIAGVRVVDRSGQAPGFVLSLKRYLVAYLSNTLLRLGYFWMIGDDRKQTWHDAMADTFVVQVRRRRQAAVRRIAAKTEREMTRVNSSAGTGRPK
jgi:uncharacterized RDD family membrane protein YckC